MLCNNYAEENSSTTNLYETTKSLSLDLKKQLINSS